MNVALLTPVAECVPAEIRAVIVSGLAAALAAAWRREHARTDERPARATATGRDAHEARTHEQKHGTTT